MKRLIVLLVIVFVSSSGVLAAANFYWHNPLASGGVDAREWDDSNNWWNTNFYTEGVPGSTDTAIIHDYDDIFPVVDSDVGQVNWLVPSYHDDVQSIVSVVPGGRIHALGKIGMCHGNNSVGVLGITGGVVVTNSLQLGFDPNSTGQVLLESGTLHCAAIYFFDGVGNIDIETGAYLHISGDVTADVNTWVDAGKITAVDGTGALIWDYNDTVAGLTTVRAISSPGGTVIYTADFEDEEVNPGRIIGSGVINSTAYPTTQPEIISDDEYGWQIKDAWFTTGDATIVDSNAYTGENSLEAINKFVRSDIEHTLEPNSVYVFSFWMMIPDDLPQITPNRIIVKDQTNDYMFVDTGLDKIYAPAPNTWFRRTVTFDTTGYVPAINGDTVDLRFGASFSNNTAEGEGSGALTDNWEIKCYRKDAPVVSYWSPEVGGNVSDDSEWAEDRNWTKGWPDSDDHAIIHNYSDVMPIIDSDVGSVNILSASWHLGVKSALRMEPGGVIDVIDFMRLGNDNGCYASLDMAGGQLSVDRFQIGYDPAFTGWNTGVVNLDGGRLTINAIGWDPNTSTSNIDLERGSWLVFDGDITETGDPCTIGGQIQWWLTEDANRLVTAADGEGLLLWDYNDTVPGKTAIWADPTTALLKNSGFNTPTVIPSAGNLREFINGDISTLSSWNMSNFCGVANVGAPILDGVVPNDDGRSGNPQACVIFTNADGFVGQVWQDLDASLWTDGDVYTINWSQAAGWRSEGVTSDPNLRVTLVEYHADANYVEHLLLQTDNISNTTLTEKSVSFTVDLNLGDANPDNDVVNYRFILDARGLEGTPLVDHGYVVVDSVSIKPFVDFEDFAKFAAQWLEEPCNATNNWCDSADFSRNGNVSLYDLEILLVEWLK